MVWETDKLHWIYAMYTQRRLKYVVLWDPCISVWLKCVNTRLFWRTRLLFFRRKCQNNIWQYAHALEKKKTKESRSHRKAERQLMRCRPTYPRGSTTRNLNYCDSRGSGSEKRPLRSNSTKNASSIFYFVAGIHIMWAMITINHRQSPLKVK